MVNYLAKFIPDLAQNTSVIRDLLKERNGWTWQPEHQKCFDDLKTACSSQPTLVYYDVNKPVKISCDSSQYGLGAVCLQDEKPVAYASRTLNDTEKRYAQIEKELLAIVYACERFHQYVYGRTVQIESDHKPLESIFQKPLYQSPLRLQRMLLKLQRYDLKVTYKKGTQLHIADTLSRACLNNTDQETEFEDLTVHATIPFSAEKSEQLKAATLADPTLTALRKIILEGWPKEKRAVDPSIKHYWDFSETLSIYDDIIFKGEKVVIPASMINTILNSVHSGHRGAEACKRRAREAVYWPTMTKDIQDHVEKCKPCNEAKPQHQKEPLLVQSPPTRPWQHIATDLFELDKQIYLLTADAYSGWFEIDHLQDIKATTIIKKIKMHISRYGIPDKLMSDNGPQYDNHHFKKFIAEYGIEHKTSSPRYPQSNGYAERAVQTAKKILSTAKKNNEDPYLALLGHRNTPRDNILGSPAQRLMARRTKTLLPISDTLLKPSVIEPSEVTKRLSHYRQQSKKYYDRTAKPLPNLQKGDVVRVTDIKGKYMKKGTVINETSYPRSYMVNINGRNYRRNRRHLLKVKEEPDSEHEYDTIVEPINQQETIVEQTNWQETIVKPSQVTDHQDDHERQHGLPRSRFGRVIKPPDRLNL
ncbi:Transposon Ty3-G Gag-Pol poly [Paramuricea clavata]|uniref:Transposon Ty3-G Gag-Pol poly n=1 Tax=Paramuricea clavata TaxID=317549 RepID=A0A7D9E9D3_PARCT|nr:Transposon Ty3-G Gag-Pol poly [Paramuricea clavata]